MLIKQLVFFKKLFQKFLQVVSNTISDLQLVQIINFNDSSFNI